MQSISTFRVEHTIRAEDINSASTPTIPAAVLGQITSGALEVRQVVTFNAQNNTLNFRGVLAPQGTATPLPNAQTATEAWNYTVAVSNLLWLTKPRNAVLFTGTVAQGTTPFGDPTGAAVSFSTGYDTPATGTGTGTGAGSTGTGTGTGTGNTGTPAQTTTTITSFTNVSTTLAGIATLFSRTGTGSLVIAGQTPSTGQLTANAGADFVATRANFQLNARRVSGTGVTYRWRFLPVFGQTATIQGADTANPTIILPDYSTAAGNYTFELTVSDASGASSTDTVVVFYDPSGR